MRLIGLFLCIFLASCASAPRAPESADGDDGKDTNAMAAIETALVEFERALTDWRRDEADAKALSTARLALDQAVAGCIEHETCSAREALAAQSRASAALAHALVGERESDPEQDPVLAATDQHAHAGEPASAADLPELARSAAMLKGRRLDEVIELNGAVKAAIEEWLTWMRPNLLDAHEHYQYLRHRMWPVYEEAGLPEALLFGILAKESGGKVHAVSRVGAAGLLQFMPATARTYGLGRSSGFDDRFDPTLITRANVAYLNDRFRELNNDLELALAAYNGGEGRMRRLAGRGGKRFFDASIYNNLPPETRDYVPMVLAAAWLYLHPDQYGLELVRFDATPTQVTLERATSINELAVCMGQFGNPRGWFRTLRNLNPGYEADTRIDAGVALEMPTSAARAYEARCRSGVLVQTATELNQARPPAASPSYRSVATLSTGSTHVVRKGETLHAIARKFGCGVPSMAAANGLRAPKYTIRVGQRLVVPSCRG